MKIEAATQYTSDLLKGINALLPQFDSSAKLLSDAGLQEILHSETTHLLVARQDGKLCGMLTLAVFRIPTGMCALIEDVVVDEASRGLGLGKKLLEAAIKLARDKGVQQLSRSRQPTVPNLWIRKTRHQRLPLAVIKLAGPGANYKLMDDLKNHHFQS